MHAAAENVEALLFLIPLIVLTVVAWRRFGAPLRAVRRGQPRDPAQLSELALAAAVAAAIRARDLPVLPRARGADRRPAATAHGCRRRAARCSSASRSCSGRSGSGSREHRGARRGHDRRVRNAHAAPRPRADARRRARRARRASEVPMSCSPASSARSRTTSPRSAKVTTRQGSHACRRECAGVFLEAVDADLDADEFAPVYVGAMHFELHRRACAEALDRLRSLGLELAVVANWDLSLRERLDEIGLGALLLGRRPRGAEACAGRAAARARTTRRQPATRAPHRRRRGRRARPRTPPACASRALRCSTRSRGFAEEATRAWRTFVLVFAALSYAFRFTEGKPPEDLLYKWSTVVGNLFQFAVILAIVYAIAGLGNRRQLLALRGPTSWRLSARIGVGIGIGMVALTYALEPLLHPGREQGDHTATLAARPRRRLHRERNRHRVVAPFVEELTFRGLGYSLLVPYGRWTAIIVVGLASGSPTASSQAFPFLAAFGAGLAYLRSRVDSVYPGDDRPRALQRDRADRCRCRTNPSRRVFSARAPGSGLRSRRSDFRAGRVRCDADVHDPGDTLAGAHRCT